MQQALCVRMVLYGPAAVVMQHPQDKEAVTVLRNSHKELVLCCLMLQE
jgi:hypothetical protein